ncbi:MAG: hypothetical protein GX250_07195 [Clostridiales bacterium]|jgi:nitrogen regulatory protein PII|nr:hypothetical protein [Clostridiales bacterium]
MKALIIVLNKTEYLEDLLTLLIEHNVKGATILDSQGMASSIVNNDITDIPLFGSLKALLRDRHPYNKTIFTVIENQEKLYKVVQAIQNLLKDEKKPDRGFIFSVPVGEIFC